MYMLGFRIEGGIARLDGHCLALRGFFHSGFFKGDFNDAGDNEHVDDLPARF
jgi:hypothetical protein